MDELIATYFARLKALPNEAQPTAVLSELEALFRRLDEVNATCDQGLLETDERELLVPIIIDAASAAGLDAAGFDGGDPTLQFRNF